MINTEYKSFTALRNPIHKTFFLLWIMGLSSLFVCAYFMSEEITGLSFSVGSAQAGMISFLMCTLTLVSCYGAWIYLTFNYRVVEYIDLFEKDLAEEKLNVIRSARALSLGKMAAGIAHEINNPLAIINTKVRRIKKLWDAEIKNPKEDIDRHLDPIIKQVNRIAYIIKALRNLTGDESEEKTKVCSLQQIIRNSHEYVETLLKEREIWFEYDDL